jgi:Spy/CpxP family protein refolding chaperone
MVLALIGSFFAGGVLFSHMHAIGDERAMPPWMHHATWADGPMAHHPDGQQDDLMTPEQHLQHARDMIDHALTGVDATADQKTKIFAIFDATTSQLKGAPLTVFMTRLQVATLLTAPTIDHDKLEALRASRVSDIDNASKLVVKAIADAGDILTQDQRTRLIMMMEHMHHAPPPSSPRG